MVLSRRLLFKGIFFSAEKSFLSGCWIYPAYVFRLAVLQLSICLLVSTEGAEKVNRLRGKGLPLSEPCLRPDAELGPLSGTGLYHDREDGSGRAIAHFVLLHPQYLTGEVGDTETDSTDVLS